MTPGEGSKRAVAPARRSLVGCGAHHTVTIRRPAFCRLSRRFIEQCGSTFLAAIPERQIPIGFRDLSVRIKNFVGVHPILRKCRFLVARLLGGSLGIGGSIHQRASWGHIASDVSQAGSRRTMLSSWLTDFSGYRQRLGPACQYKRYGHSLSELQAVRAKLQHHAGKLQASLVLSGARESPLPKRNSPAL